MIPCLFYQAMSKIGHKIQSTLTCFTKGAKCMTLSVLENGIPMQRSHDIIASNISALVKHVSVHYVFMIKILIIVW